MTKLKCLDAAMEVFHADYILVSLGGLALHIVAQPDESSTYIDNYALPDGVDRNSNKKHCYLNHGKE